MHTQIPKYNAIDFDKSKQFDTCFNFLTIARILIDTHINMHTYTNK